MWCGEEGGKWKKKMRIIDPKMVFMPSRIDSHAEIDG